MRTLLTLGCLAACLAAAPAFAAPTKGAVYALEFLDTTPEDAPKPHEGRYCGTWMNNGTRNALIVFKLKRDRTFADLTADEQEGTLCNADMKSYYEQAAEGVRALEAARRPPPYFYPLPRIPRPVIPRLPGPYIKK